jgi:RNA polymerase sigma-70 factor (ECF subfamily)
MQYIELKAQLEQHHKDCYSWALHCCKEDAEMASDVLQTAYLKILEKQNTFGARSAFKTWAFIIIKNTATDAWKSSQKRSKFIRYADHLPDAGFETDTETVADVRVRELFFSEALQQVSERQRQILELVFYHDMSLNEAAKVLGVSPGGARKHYDRAKKVLSIWFQKKGVTKISL